MKNQGPARVRGALRTASVLALIAAGAALAASSLVQAFPAAQVDAQIRPPLGALLDPPLLRYHPHRPDWRQGYWDVGDGQRWDGGPQFRGRWGQRDWRREHDYPDQGPLQTITVTCGDDSFGLSPVSDALEALADGGTLYIRPGPRPCAESLVITRPVTIVGEAPPAFSTGAAIEPATLAPPPGMPCLRILPGVKAVELRDLTLDAGQAGRSACIEAWDSDVALVRSRVRYVGDAAAVFLSGGRLLAHESAISAVSYDPAVTVEGAYLDFRRVKINSSATGIDLTPIGGAVATLDHVAIVAAPSPNAGAVPEAGLIVRPVRGAGATVLVKASSVMGYKTSLWFQQGATVTVDSSRLEQARLGVLSDGADLSITHSSIDAERTGIYVITGRAKITGNEISGFYDLPIDGESGAVIQADDNWIYPARGCYDYRAYGGACQRGDLGPEARHFQRDGEGFGGGWRDSGPWDHPAPSKDHDRDKDRDRSNW